MRAIIRLHRLAQFIFSKGSATPQFSPAFANAFPERNNSSEGVPRMPNSGVGTLGACAQAAVWPCHGKRKGNLSAAERRSRDSFSFQVNKVERGDACCDNGYTFKRRSSVLPALSCKAGATHPSPYMAVLIYKALSEIADAMHLIT
ncbi:MAG: hypothetical protein ACOYIH_09640 [Candidatus Fimadaptatus sp.]